MLLNGCKSFSMSFKWQVSVTKKLDKKLRLIPLVSIRINSGSIRTSVATPVKIFHIFL